MECTAKHTKFQPTDKQWECPKCGSDNNHFTINNSVEGSDDNCPLLHSDDEVECSKCETGWSGDQVSKLMAKKLNRVVCPTCKGVGYVDGKKKGKVQ